MNNEDNWRFAGFKGSTTQAYDQKLAIPPKDPRFLVPQTATNAVNRMSPSGTDWNATFGRNQISSPSGTNWSKTFGYNGGSSPSGTDWSKAFGSPFLAPKSAPASTFNFTLGGDLSQLKLGSTTTNGANRIASAGEELDLPNDPFRKLFKGGIPTPTPAPSPSPTSGKYMASSPVIPPNYQVPKMDREEQLYGWGSGYA